MKNRKIKRALKLSARLLRITALSLLTLQGAALAAPLAAPLAASAPIAAPAPALNFEPDTVFDANRWYDRWWDESVKGLKDIPGTFVDDMGATKAMMGKIFTKGIKVGNVLVVRGAPEAAEIFLKHGEQVGIKFVDTIRMMPDHLVKAGGHFKDHGKHAWKTLVDRGSHTGDVAKEEWRRFGDNTDTALDAMKSVGNWTKEAAWNDIKTTGNDIADDSVQTYENIKSASQWTGRNIGNALEKTSERMGRYATWNFQTSKDIALWSARQIPEGWDDTVRWTSNAARSTGKWTSSMAETTADWTVDEIKQAGKNIPAAAGHAKNAIVATAEGFDYAAAKVMNGTGHAVQKIQSKTFENIPGVAKASYNRTLKHADWLWKKGFHESFLGGLDQAHDEYMAGDFEGMVILASYYSLAGTLGGIGYVLVLEPLAFTGNVGTGVTKTVALAAAGAVGTTLVGTAGVATSTALRVSGVAATVGVAAIGGTYLSGVIAKDAALIAGKAVVGGALTAGAAVAGGTYTVGSAVTGAVRTVGAVAVGTTAASVLNTVGFVAGETAIGAAGILHVGGTVAAGTAWTAGSLALGGAKVAGDIAWGATKMVGIASLGVAGEVLIPAAWSGVTGYRLAKVAGTAVVDNVIVTPAVAAWDLLSALTMGGWELVRDPVDMSYHLVAGASGFAYTLTGQLSAQTMTAVGGTLYAVAKVPLSLVYYGGMWTLAATGKVNETLFSFLQFSAQNQWKAERKPQLETIVGQQSLATLNQIGSSVTYIRVIWSGSDRGKVNFFTTEKNGRLYKFHRKLRADCQIIYVEKSQGITLPTDQFDRACVQSL